MVTSVTHASQRSYKLTQTHMVKVPISTFSISTLITLNFIPVTIPNPIPISIASSIIMLRIGGGLEISTVRPSVIILFRGRNAHKEKSAPTLTQGSNNSINTKPIRRSFALITQ